MSEKIKIGGYLLVISVILGLVYFLLIAPLNSNSIPSSKHSGFFNQVCTEGFGMMVSQPNTNKEPTNSKSQFSTWFLDSCFSYDWENVDAKVQYRVDSINKKNAEKLAKTNAPNGFHNDGTNSFKKTCEKLGGAYLSGIIYKEYNPAWYEDSCRDGAESIDGKVMNELFKNQSTFDSFESPPGLVENATNYSSGTKEFTDPWKATTMISDDKSDKTQLMYSYCDIIGKTIDAVRPAGLTSFDVFEAFYSSDTDSANPSIKPNIPVIVSGDVTEIRDSLAQDFHPNSGFAFRKSEYKACFVTFTQDDGECINHALDICHVTFRIDDSNAEAFGAHLKDVLGTNKWNKYLTSKKYSNEMLNAEQDAVVKDAIREVDENKYNQKTTTK